MGKISGVDAALITSIAGVAVANISKVGPTSATTLGLGGNFNPVYFSKENYATSTVDVISPFVHLARGNNQSLYNAVSEAMYEEGFSPAGTEWNAEGGNLSNYATREYGLFVNVLLNNVGSNIFNKPLIMHDISDDKYYLFVFHTWTQNNAGGGFSYTRLRLDKATLFSKTNYATNISDPISSFVHLARGDNSGLYNSTIEENYQYPSSPLYTEWNSDSGSVANYANRTYTNFADSLQYSVGNLILKKALIMHDINDHKYYSFIFTGWTQNNGGGGFSYARILLKPENNPVKVFSNGNWDNSSEPCIYGPESIITKGSQTLYYNSGNNTIYTDPTFETIFLGEGKYWYNSTDNQWWWINNEGGVIGTGSC